MHVCNRLPKLRKLIFRAQRLGNDRLRRAVLERCPHDARIDSLRHPASQRIDGHNALQPAGPVDRLKGGIDQRYIVFIPLDAAIKPVAFARLDGVQHIVGKPQHGELFSSRLHARAHITPAAFCDHARRRIEHLTRKKHHVMAAKILDAVGEPQVNIAVWKARKQIGIRIDPHLLQRLLPLLSHALDVGDIHALSSLLQIKITNGAARFTAPE